MAISGGPYLAIIRYLLQRPDLIGFFDGEPSADPSQEARALNFLVQHLHARLEPGLTTGPLVARLQGSEFAAIYMRIERLIADLGDTGEDVAAFQDALSSYKAFESKAARRAELARQSRDEVTVTATNAEIDAERQWSESFISARRTPYQTNDDPFLRSREWRVVRMRVLKRDGARCACCGTTRMSGARLNVDHIKSRHSHPELALTESNLQVLCESCNQGKGNWDETDWRG